MLLVLDCLIYYAVLGELVYLLEYTNILSSFLWRMHSPLSLPPTPAEGVAMH